MTSLDDGSVESLAIARISRAFEQLRRHGHTTLAIRLAEAEGAILVVGSSAQIRSLPEHRCPVTPLHCITEDLMHGTRRPLILDHYAVQMAFYEARDRLRRAEQERKALSALVAKAGDVDELEMSAELREGRRVLQHGSDIRDTQHIESLRKVAIAALQIFNDAKDSKLTYQQRTDHLRSELCAAGLMSASTRTRATPEFAL